MPTSEEAFLAEYTTLHRAGVGVTAVRTREPFRALETIQRWSYANLPNNPFKLYSMVNGWTEFDSKNPDAPPQCDKDRDMVNAMRKIDGHGGETAFPDGTYAVFWPHFQLPKAPAFVQIMAEIARASAEKIKRVAMIVPTSFKLPPELHELVAIVDFGLPTREELQETYDMVCSPLENADERPAYSGADMDRILNAVTGMTAMEAESAIARAGIKFAGQFPDLPVDTFAAEVLKIKTEVIKRSECLEIMPVETMANVGGLEALKTWIRDRRSAFTQAAREAGVDRPKGILLVGPPGAGKSLAAKASADSLGLPLVRFDLSKVYGSLVGESEGKVRDALKTIEAMAPLVVLADELDKAVSKGTGGRTSDVSTRILGTLLTFMQESNADIFWVMTANRVQDLPSELVRKGRLDEIFSVDIPNENERRAILGIHLRKRKEDINAPDIANRIDEVIEHSSGYVGAEIEAAIKEAKILAFNAGKAVSADLLIDQFRHAKPLSVAFKDDFEEMQTWAANNARPASGAPRATNAPVAARPRERTRRMVPSAAQLDS